MRQIMEGITLGDIDSFVTLMVGLIGGIGFLYKKLKKWLEVLFEKQMAEIRAELKELSKRIDKSDMENCKNFLVQCLADLDRGQDMTETEMQRFYEEYQHYIDNDGNSYVKREVEKMQKAGKL